MQYVLALLDEASVVKETKKPPPAAIGLRAETRLQHSHMT